MDRRLKKRMERIWSKASIDCKKEIDSLDFSSWFDYWHTHPDFKFKGNKNEETRKMVAVLTYELLEYVIDKVEQGSNDLQVWATICQNTGDNAIYIHSLNPNNTPFPYDYDGVEWNVENIIEEIKFIDQKEYEIGILNYEEGVNYIIKKRI